MKNTYLAVALLTFFSLNANQVILGRFMKKNRMHHEVTRQISEPSPSSFVDFEEIDANEKIDTRQLVKWWVPILGGLTKHIFVFYNQILKWWHSSNKKKLVRG